MKTKQKVLLILVILSSIITIILGVVRFVTDYESLDIMMIFLGITQIFGGLSQINMAHELKSQGVGKVNKVLGVFLVILGIIIICAVSIKMIVD